MKANLVLLLLCYALYTAAQQTPFVFGQVTHQELGMKVYEKDTAAAALVLNEFGEAYIDNENDHNLIFDYHVKILILRKNGLAYADFEIPLYKKGTTTERIKSLRASTFNLENGSIQETKLNSKGVFMENMNKRWNVQKFVLPNVRVGSIIEVNYKIESPFVYNFRQWNFQSSIPKIHSEYWATIPGNYRYNISLKGFLKLDKNENELVRECFTPGGGMRADCSRFKWAIDDVPAFIEEEYMTAPSNFISSINFELAEIRYFDGRVDKVTKEWKDAEDELKREERFGLQLRRGKDIVDASVKQVLSGETDPLMKAQKIYQFMLAWYRWNEVFGIFSDLGIKKAFDQKTGNVADINLSLIAALKYAGLDVEPVILSTRSNGMPTDLYPVLSDFNYVIAKLNLGDKVYLLDATDDFMPFGMLPQRCLNGRGRVFGEKGSYWYEITPADRSKLISTVRLKLHTDGRLSGTIQTAYRGYKAAEQRRKIYSFLNPQQYIDETNKKLDKIHIEKFHLMNLDDFNNKSLVESWDVEIEGYTIEQGARIFLNPFVVRQWTENPFKFRERLYPVDFGAPLEETILITLEYPAEFSLIDFPANVGLALPNAGGRYLFDVKNEGNAININYSLLVGKTVFSSEEYHYLKELFNYVVNTHGGQLVFERKM